MHVADLRFVAATPAASAARASLGGAGAGVRWEGRRRDTWQEHDEPLPYAQIFTFDMRRVLDEVQAVIAEPDPQAALAERLAAAQTAECALFARLPNDRENEDRTLRRHQQQLRANQATYDAALEALRQLSGRTR